LAAAGSDARVLFFSNPMNPVGSWIDGSALHELASRLPANCLLVVDEAYFEYAAGPGYADGLAVLGPLTRPWVVLRTGSGTAPARVVSRLSGVQFSAFRRGFSIR
jgi:histidinol-phosphate/aromatic aminotransferase/cobyric acid decarboxylase-like protein